MSRTMTRDAIRHDKSRCMARRSVPDRDSHNPVLNRMLLLLSILAISAVGGTWVMTIYRMLYG